MAEMHSDTNIPSDEGANNTMSGNSKEESEDSEG